MVAGQIEGTANYCNTRAGAPAPHSNSFAILETYADPREHRRNRQGNEHHFQGDVSTYGCGELSRWPRSSARSDGPGAVSRCPRSAARRKWTGEVCCMFPVRGKLPG